MTADELMGLATRLANQCFVRYWLHWNYPCEKPWYMAIETRNILLQQVRVPDLEKAGMEWDEVDRRHYVLRDFPT